MGHVPHIIVTRFGLGQKNPAFFSAHFLMMKNILWRSLQSQTRKDFHWVVVTDALCPIDVQEEVRKLSIDGSSTHLVLHDPFAEGRFMPNGGALLARIGLQAESVIITRIDDDDALASQFCEILQDEVLQIPSSLRRKPTYLKYNFGVMAAPAINKYLSVRYPNYSVVSLLTANPEKFHPYAFNHIRAERDILKKGGRSLPVNWMGPMWVAVKRTDSESSRGDREKLLNTLAAVEAGQHKNIKLSRRVSPGEVLPLFGLEESALADAIRLSDEDVSDYPDLLNDRSTVLKRMEIKKLLLKIAREKMRDLPEEKADRVVVALREAFYRI